MDARADMESTGLYPNARTWNQPYTHSIGGRRHNGCGQEFVRYCLQPYIIGIGRSNRFGGWFTLYSDQLCTYPRGSDWDIGFRPGADRAVAGSKHPMESNGLYPAESNIRLAYIGSPHAILS